MNAPLPRIVIDNDTPQRLGVVAAQFGLTAAALRTEAKRGRLVISRVAGKDWTSVAEVQRMFGLCRSTPKESDSGSDRPVATSDPRGSSETLQSRSALDALSLASLATNTAKAVETFELADRLARLEEQIAAKGSTP